MSIKEQSGKLVSGGRQDESMQFKQFGTICRNTVDLEGSCQSSGRGCQMFLELFCQRLVKKARNLAVKRFMLSCSVIRNNTAEQASPGIAGNLYYREALGLTRALVETHLKRKHTASKQEQALSSKQNFCVRISSTASATLPSYLLGSFKPMDWHRQTSLLFYVFISILSYTCLKK